MTGADKAFVDMCNWASASFDGADAILKHLGNEELLQLQGLVRLEMSSSAGAPEVVLAVIKAVIDDEVLVRTLTP